MKKVFSSVVAAVVAASIFFSGCSGIEADNSDQQSKTATYVGDYGKYAQVGTDVYAALQEAFGTAETARAALKWRDSTSR